MCSVKYFYAAALFSLFSVALCTTCQKGRKMAHIGALICLECDPGTFMPEDNHNKTECYPCSTVGDSRTEVVLRECSIEEDALIACKPRFFKHGNTCEACEVCESGYEIQACYGSINTICCPSDRFYIHDDSNGVKVCRVRTLPCRQGQFFASGNVCEPCQPGTYMVENHHNNTACTSCLQIPESQEIDGYVASACNITRNSNITDQASTAPSMKAIKVAAATMLILVTLGLLILLVGLLLVKHMVASSKWLLSVMNCLGDHQLALDGCFYILLSVLIMCCLITSIALFVNSGEVFVIFMMCFIAFCVFALIVLAVLYFLLRHHRSRMANQDFASSSFI